MSSTGSDTQPWWRSAVIYQVYPRSFADSDGSGVGDLVGIRSRLDYIAELGVDAVWLNPFYKSPQADAGYDVADYRAVDPLFGTLEDFDELLTAAHDKGVRVIVDLVPNHTSSEHVWFQAALAAKPGSPERDRYLFKPGRGEDGGEPPTNWISQFGGSAWTRLADGDWYLHLYNEKQPDLNWTNPEVIEEFHSILRFWLDRGVDGFRIDVAHALAKDPAMPDVSDPHPHSHARPGHPYWDLDAVHPIYRGWRAILDSYPGDRTFVAEAWVEDGERLKLYLRPDELHTAFNFNFFKAPFEVNAMRHAVEHTLETLSSVGAPPTWVLSNHDKFRPVTRFGDGDLGQQRARAAALLMLALPGGAYVYQGEELGLEEVQDIPVNKLQDPTWVQSGGSEKGRDGCRVPMPWSGDAPPFGFSPDGGEETWLPQPTRWAPITADKQSHDSASMLNLYRSALRLRHDLPALGDGTLHWVESDEDILAFEREPGFACVVNFSNEPKSLPSSLGGCTVILGSAALVDDKLAPNSTVWLAK